LERTLVLTLLVLTLLLLTLLLPTLLLPTLLLPTLLLPTLLLTLTFLGWYQAYIWALGSPRHSLVGGKWRAQGAC
jgi:hypothetical protein